MTFTLNGQTREALTKTITYEEIAKLVGHVHPSVTYRFKNTGADGILSPGDRLGLAPDLVISAYDTSSA